MYLSQPISQPFGTTCEISHCVIDKMAMWAGRGRWEVADCAVLSRPWRQIYDNINNLAAKESEPETRSLPIRIRIPIRIRGIRLARNFMTQQKLSTAARRQIAYKTTKSIKWWEKKTEKRVTCDRVTDTYICRHILQILFATHKLKFSQTKFAWKMMRSGRAFQYLRKVFWLWLIPNECCHSLHWAFQLKFFVFLC